MGSLEGKVAMVTGASRGIGAAVARVLASEGVRLGVGSRSGHDLGVARPEDVAEVVRFVLTRPRTHRILEVAFRPVAETSWG